VVDEVLAVGDAAFQKKCLGKMEEVGKEGRTVLFVSHNMGMISHLCKNAILLNKGLNVREGNVEEVVSYYISKLNAGNDNIYISRDTGSMLKDMCVLEANTIDDNCNVISDYKVSDPIILSIILKINKCPKNVFFGVSVNDHRVDVSFYHRKAIRFH
jgi:lipopolysaccharide transport system ATP-binding protein